MFLVSLTPFLPFDSHTSSFSVCAIFLQQQQQQQQQPKKQQQANETFQRAEKHLFMNQNVTDAVSSKGSCSTELNNNNIRLRSLRAERAMTFSILAADGLSHVNQLYDKLVAYRRTTQYHLLAQELMRSLSKSGPESGPEEKVSLLPPAEIHPATDVATGLASLQPLLTEALLSNLQHPVYAVRTASARSLQYVLDHVNCSVGNMFPQIFQSLVRVYPVENHKRRTMVVVDDDEEEDDMVVGGGSNSFNKMEEMEMEKKKEEKKEKKKMKTSSNHHIDEKHVVLLLETCYNMFPSLSRPELQQIVTGTVEPCVKKINFLFLVFLKFEIFFSFLFLFVFRTKPLH